MKAYKLKKFLSMILVIVIFTTSCLTGFAEGISGARQSAGDVLVPAKGVTWAEAGKQLAGMLGYIVEDAADIDLSSHAERIRNLSIEDNSIYLAILAENGYLPEDIGQIDPAGAITADAYVQLMEEAFPTVLDSQTAIDMLRG